MFTAGRILFEALDEAHFCAMSRCVWVRLMSMLANIIMSRAAQSTDSSDAIRYPPIGRWNFQLSIENPLLIVFALFGRIKRAPLYINQSKVDFSSKAKSSNVRAFLPLIRTTIAAG